jgi:hypothetical protein
MKRLMAITVIATLLGFVPAASAEGMFIHHWDLLQVTTHNGKTKVLDTGYHFSTVLLAGRVQLLGVGAGLDTWSVHVSGEGNWYADRNVFHCSPYLIGHIVSIALASPRKAKLIDHPYISFGANYVYHLVNKEHRVAVGFDVSYRSLSTRASRISSGRFSLPGDALLKLGDAGVVVNELRGHIVLECLVVPAHWAELFHDESESILHILTQQLEVFFGSEILGHTTGEVLDFSLELFGSHFRHSESVPSAYRKSNYISMMTGSTIGRLSVFWKRNWPMSSRISSLRYARFSGRIFSPSTIWRTRLRTAMRRSFCSLR